MEITVQKDDTPLVIKRCTDCCSSYHCPFCPPKYFKPTTKTRLENHLTLHFKRSVQHEGYTIYRCKHSCRNVSHFHCPYCKSTLTQKVNFLNHLQICNREDKSVTTVQAPSVAEPNIAPPDSKNWSLQITNSKLYPHLPECHIKLWKINVEKYIEHSHTAEEKDSSDSSNKHPLSPVFDNEGASTQNMDITIQRGDALPELERCTDCCSYFHCPFCSPKYLLPDKKCRVKSHLKFHFKTSVQHEGYTIHRCRRPCRNTPHFHCPYCKSTLIQKVNFLRHLQICDREDKSVTTVQAPSAADGTSEPSVAPPDPKNLSSKMTKLNSEFPESDQINVEKRTEHSYSTAEEMDSSDSSNKHLLSSVFGNEGAERQMNHLQICNREEKSDTTVQALPAADGTSETNVAPPDTQNGSFNKSKSRLLQKCPECHLTVYKKNLLKHIERRHSAKEKDTSVSSHERISSAATDEAAELEQNMDTTILEEDTAVQALLFADGTPEQNFTSPSLTCKKQTLRQKCPNCHLTFNKKNLKIHIKRRHSLENSSSHLKSECVDPQNGIYAVHKSLPGVSRPFHVQIQMQGEEQYVSCEFSLCQAKMQLAQKCIHLQSVLNCSTFLTSPCLTERTLTEIVKRRLFRKSRIKMCIDRQIQAIQQNVPLSVQSEVGVPPSKKYISVYEPNISHFSKLHRVMVSYNTKTNVWYCPCSGTRNCTHKYIAKWHLFQKDPDLFPKVALKPKTGAPKAKRPKTRSRKVQKPEAAFVSAPQPQTEFQRPEVEVQSDSEDTTMEILETIATAMETNVSVVSYPPKEVQMIKNMVHYLLVNKKLPSVPPEHLALPSAEKEFPQHLVPAETYCLYCADAIALSQPILITHKAKILTSSRAVQDVSTYYKFCPRCGVPYRYQEWGDGLHNFNDHLLLDLPLCLSIRNMLQAHNGFGQIVEYLKSSVGAAFPSADTLLGAYLHFEALTDHQHQYSCVTWGERPPVVVMELQNKAFNLSGRDLAGPAAALNGPGDMDHLWKALTEERIARGLVSSTKKSVLYKIL